MHVDIVPTKETRVQIESLRGPRGETGPAGPRGERGPSGPKGEAGAPGAAGPAGKDGAGIQSFEQYMGGMGDGVANRYLMTLTDGRAYAFAIYNGSRGPQGEPGTAGLQGPPGVPGEPGQQGADGFTPIVRLTQMTNGAVIRVTDQNGEQTATVNHGAKGDKGDKGDPGETGPAGPAGYTPVKGTDYYTAADKTEMVNLVLAALPAAEGVSY